MTPAPTPTPVVPWRTAMREHHVLAPRQRTWSVLLAALGEDAGDLSVEPPWRHVRHRAVDGVQRCETTVCLRDDGAECHLAWCVGTTAEGEQADQLLADLAREAKGLLEDVAGIAEQGVRGRNGPSGAGHVDKSER